MSENQTLSTATKLNLLRQEYKKLQKQFQEFQEENPKKEQEIQELEKLNKGLKNQFQEKENKIVEIQNQIIEISKIKKQSKQNLQSITKELQNLKDAHQKLNLESQSKQEDIKKFNTLQQEREDFHKNLNNLNEEMEKIRDEIFPLDQKVTDLKIENAKSKSNEKELSEKIKQEQETRSEMMKEEDKNIRKYFGFPETEYYVNSYFCWKGIVNGTLYITTNYICFYPRIFSKPIVFPIQDLIEIEKQKNISMIDNSLQFTRKSNKEVYVFASFVGSKRDHCISDILELA
ncbi:hypothetical protein M0811_13630 [Anaeramoeba ignava]|uniref:GRAM domain-containing protein n=1 Tax=Anaeramoeba ignava TaxID=1746090 RepID=A0A9Q0R453_ANAIG|nr:hypothetical protein M0811_13630 [Anaeramoeba ignava]